MKLTFDRATLEAAVDASMSSVSDKNTIPIIEGIRFKTEKNGKCSITTYDLEKGFRTEVDCRIEEGGNYVINASKLSRIIKLMPDISITIEVSDKCAVTVTSGKSKFELHAMEGSGYPNLPELTGERGFTVNAGILKKMISQTSFAIATTDQRPMLCGSFFKVEQGKLKIVCCDGNRLAVRERECEITNKNADGSDLDLAFIVPGRTILSLSRLMDDDDDVEIYLTRKHVIFKLSDMTFFSRLIDSEYIAYDRVIPKNRASVVRVQRSALISSLERALLVTEERAMGQAKSYVKCTIDNELMKIESVSVSGSIYDEMPIVKDGDDLIIGFHCKLMLEAVRSTDTDELELVFNGPLTSVVINPIYDNAKEAKETENKEKIPYENYLYMVAPVKMK